MSLSWPVRLHNIWPWLPDLLPTARLLPRSFQPHWPPLCSWLMILLIFFFLLLGMIFSNSFVDFSSLFKWQFLCDLPSYLNGRCLPRALPAQSVAPSLLCSAPCDPCYACFVYSSNAGLPSLVVSFKEARILACLVLAESQHPVPGTP